MKKALAFLLLAAASAGMAGAVECAVDFTPGATLLLPYFEVDIDDPNGIDTVFTINNAYESAALTHVIVWTDMSVEALDFNVYLTGYDMQSVSMGLIIRDGILPRTASAGQDPADTISPQGVYSYDINFPSCGGVLPYTNPALDADFLAHLQSILTGGPSAIYNGKCGGADYGDNIARGYVTVDNMYACTLLTPCDVGYFADESGIPGTGLASYENQLWGSWWIIDGGNNSAIGDNLVTLEAFSPETNGVGPAAPSGVGPFYSFWNRCFNSIPGADLRESPSSEWGSLYFENAAFQGGSSVIVWRDSLYPSTRGFSCAAGPAWFPLPQDAFIAFDEQENPDEPFCNVSPCPEEDSVFPIEAQQVDISSFDLAASSGWLYLDLGQYGYYAPSWVVSVQSAAGRFSAGATALPYDSYCYSFIKSDGE